MGQKRANVNKHNGVATQSLFTKKKRQHKSITPRARPSFFQHRPSTQHSTAPNLLISCSGDCRNFDDFLDFSIVFPEPRLIDFGIYRSVLLAFARFSIHWTWTSRFRIFLNDLLAFSHILTRSWPVVHPHTVRSDNWWPLTRTKIHDFDVFLTK